MEFSQSFGKSRVRSFRFFSASVLVFREGDFKEDDAIWKGEEGGVAGGIGPGGLGGQGGTQGGYIAK